MYQPSSTPFSKSLSSSRLASLGWSQLKQKREELQLQQRSLDARLEALGEQRHLLQQRQQVVTRALKKVLKAQGILSSHRESRMEVRRKLARYSSGRLSRA